MAKEIVFKAHFFNNFIKCITYNTRMNLLTEKYINRFL